MRLGESAGDYGFRRPKSVSIPPGVSPTTVWDREVYVNLKNEDTWCGELSHFDAEYDTALRTLERQWHGRFAIRFATFNRWNDERNVDVNRNDNRWNRNYRFGGVRNSLYFSPDFLLGEFCFKTWPFQPPSILPISFTFSDRAMYFLSSRDLHSQRTISNILRVSNFLIPSLMLGNFSSRRLKLASVVASIISTNKSSIL